MSITLDFDAKNWQKSKQLSLHYLPAKIQGDGEANVEKCFNNYTRENPDYGTGILTNSLRGYPLLGQQANVPSGLKGLVLQETEKPLIDTSERQLRLTGQFDEFTYWNYDKVPSNSDGYRQALLMTDVAEALMYQQIKEEDLEAEIQRHKESKKENS
ncbi:LOW QUALITY PROTEIN: ribonuclease H2 subunit C [Drosophila tropicalis]|uniref:LOW QUALITY PROTEIN: ribonuclease H2 subunit C n=1 Tax=Drosophila tropicalis TaxID=46794 RepID=UPI0035ABEBD7